MAGLADRYIDSMVAFLQKEGERILSECEDEREYNHDTMNLYDSYGYGIYVRGRLVKSGYLSPSPMADEPRKWYKQRIWGREQIKNFLEAEYKPGKGIEMVVAAAMPYAEVLENASSGQTRKYRVISMSYEKLKSVGQRLGGASRRSGGPPEKENCHSLANHRENVCQHIKIIKKIKIKQ